MNFVCADIKGSDDEKIREGLRRVETFWSRYDYDNLVDSLVAQSDYMHCDDVPDGSCYGMSDEIDELLNKSTQFQRKKYDVELFYHETYDFRLAESSLMCMKYFSDVDAEFSKRIKHKKANDNNGIFIYNEEDI